MTRPANSQDRPRRRNRAIVLACVGTVAGMVGLTYASVPLYRLFCQVTGYGGTPRIGDDRAGAGQVLERMVTVRFDASVVRDLAWSFKPEQTTMKVRLGEDRLAFYKARNEASRAVTGTATFNVTPEWAAQYFVKIDCFCFTEQTLQPGESADMPVSFYVDPAIVEDKDAARLDTLTLSYTFFAAARQPEAASLSQTGAGAKNSGGRS